MMRRDKPRRQRDGNSRIADRQASDPSPTALVATPERRTPRDDLLHELWAGESPFDFADVRHVDDGYPDTYLPVELVEALLTEWRPRFWLELGTALGGSALRTAVSVKALGLETSICCIDAFTGDVNMWSWEKGRRERGDWRYLRLEAGRQTMYERFLANVHAAGHGDLIVPLPCTTLVGLRLLRLMHEEERLSQLPRVIYLDGAHEPGETLLELRSAWLTLEPGGVLFGDDWLWPSVRGDVQAFAGTVEVDASRLVAMLRRFPESELAGNVFLYGGHWALFKPAT